MPRDVRGRVLLTSRASTFGVLGIRDPFRIKTLPPAEAKAFLLDRAERHDASEEERQAAAELADDLGGLPLALEQAGAYVASREMRFANYLATYRREHVRQLERIEPETKDAAATPPFSAPPGATRKPKHWRLKSQAEFVRDALSTLERPTNFSI